MDKFSKRLLAYVRTFGFHFENWTKHLKSNHQKMRTTQHWYKLIEEKISFATCFMQLYMSYATRKCCMQLFFSCIQHVWLHKSSCKRQIFILRNCFMDDYHFSYITKSLKKTLALALVVQDIIIWIIFTLLRCTCYILYTYFNLKESILYINDIHVNCWKHLKNTLY